MVAAIIVARMFPRCDRQAEPRLYLAKWFDELSVFVRVPDGDACMRSL